MDNESTRLPPLVGKVIEADFEKGTLTLEMIGPYYAAYQVYELVPKSESFVALHS